MSFVYERIPAFEAQPEPELPNRMSALLRIAVQDAKKLDLDPRFVLDMTGWVWVKSKDECHVCMAGAVMVCRLGILNSNLVRSLAPADLPTEVGPDSEKLYAIDSMRTGMFRHALHQLDPECSPDPVQERIMKQLSNLITENLPERFVDRVEWDIYLEAADRLEAVGL